MDATSMSALKTSPLLLHHRAATPCLFASPAGQRRRTTHLVVRAKSGRDKDVKLKKGSKSPVKSSGGTVRVGILESIFGNLFQPSPTRSSSGRQDPKTVFVAGASGRLGSRCVRTIVSEGFKVIAGARNVDKAAELLNEFVESGDLTSGQARSVRIVPFDVADEDSIRGAIGNAGKIVSAIGATEGGSFKDIDGTGNIQLINTAAEIGVKQFVLVTSIGAGKFILPASLLNLLGGALSWKKRSEEALEKSGMQYTIVRPGGMERPTDNYKETHNVKIYKRDTQGGGLVSRLQVAELVASCVLNPDLAVGKCLEVIAETKAPLMDYEDLLEGAEADVTEEEIEEIRLKNTQRIKDRAAFAAQVSNLAQTLETIQARKNTIQDRIKEAKSKANAISKENTPAIQASSKILKEIASLENAAEAKARQEKAAQAVLQAAKLASREGQLLTSKEQKEIEFPILQPEAAEANRIKEEEKRAASEAAATAQAAKEAAAAEAKAAKEAEAAARAEAAEKAKPAKKVVPAKAVTPPKPVEKAADGPGTSPVVEKVAEVKKTKPVVKKVETPSFPRKPPVKATERMAKPPPKAVRASVKPSVPTIKVEPASAIEARVLAAVEEAALEKKAKEAKEREAASKKAIADQKKADEAAVKAAKDALAKQAKEREAAMAKAKAKIEEAAKQAAAAAAAAAEVAEKRKAEAELRKEDTKKAKIETAEKAAVPQKSVPATAAKAKSPKPAKTKSPGSGFNFGKAFSGFKAPWAKPTPEELDMKRRKSEVNAWIANWKSGAVAEKVLAEPDANAPSQDGETSKTNPEGSSNNTDTQAEQGAASEWIRQWRAKSLEKALPSDKKVNK